MFADVLLVSLFSYRETSSPSTSAAARSFMNGHRVRDGRDGAGIVHDRKLNDIQTDLFVSVADSGSSTRRAVSEVPDEIDQLAVRVNRGGGVEQNAFPENGRVVGEPAAGNGRDVLNMDDEFSCIGLSGAVQNRQSYNILPRLLVAPLGLNAMNRSSVLIGEFPRVLKDSRIIIGERAG